MVSVASAQSRCVRIAVAVVSRALSRMGVAVLSSVVASVVGVALVWIASTLTGTVAAPASHAGSVTVSVRTVAYVTSATDGSGSSGGSGDAGGTAGSCFPACGFHFGGSGSAGSSGGAVSDSTSSATSDSSRSASAGRWLHPGRFASTPTAGSTGSGTPSNPASSFITWMSHLVAPPASSDQPRLVDDIMRPGPTPRPVGFVGGLHIRPRSQTDQPPTEHLRGPGRSQAAGTQRTDPTGGSSEQPSPAVEPLLSGIVHLVSGIVTTLAGQPAGQQTQQVLTQAVSDVESAMRTAAALNSGLNNSTGATTNPPARPIQNNEAARPAGRPNHHQRWRWEERRAEPGTGHPARRPAR